MLDAELVGIDLSEPGPTGTLTLHWLRAADGARQDESIPVARLDDKQRKRLLKALDRALNGAGTRITVDRRASVPVQDIIDLYHRMLPELPRTEKLTAARRDSIIARWNEGDLPSLATWSDFFGFVRESRFLMGKVAPTPGRTRFIANLEWLAKAGNYAKIREGKFHRD